MGGEPTFVSIDDFEHEEWNAGAVGPNKRRLSDQLIRRLRDRFAPGGMLHFGQGKWYPGETLPRWAFALYWRKDGVPIWRDAKLIAPVPGLASPPKQAIKDRPPEVKADAERERAFKLAEGIALRLGVSPEYVTPAFEDPATWVVKESNLPTNVDPLDPKIEDAEERNRMIRTFGRGLTKPSGFVLASSTVEFARGIALDQREMAFAGAAGSS